MSNKNEKYLEFIVMDYTFCFLYKIKNCVIHQLIKIQYQLHQFSTGETQEIINWPSRQIYQTLHATKAPEKIISFANKLNKADKFMNRYLQTNILNENPDNHIVFLSRNPWVFRVVFQ